MKDNIEEIFADKVLQIENNLGTWILPSQYVQKEYGGSRNDSGGVIGDIADGEKHSDHIVLAALTGISAKSKSLGDNVVIVDAGSHIGNISVELSKELSAKSLRHKLFAIEMIPLLAYCTVENIKNNTNSDYCEWEVNNAPLTSHEQLAKQNWLSVPTLENKIENIDFDSAADKSYSTNLISDGNHTNIKATTIDNCLIDNEVPVAVLKVDCEGYDLEVLKGAVNTINKHRPVIIFETFDHSEIEIDFVNPFTIDVRKMLAKEYSDFFSAYDYKWMVNPFYTSINEMIAFPSELIDFYEEIFPALKKDIEIDYVFKFGYSVDNEHVVKDRVLEIICKFEHGCALKLLDKWKIRSDVVDYPDEMMKNFKHWDSSLPFLYKNEDGPDYIAVPNNRKLLRICEDDFNNFCKGLNNV